MLKVFKRQTHIAELDVTIKCFLQHEDTIYNMLEKVKSLCGDHREEYTSHNTI